MAHPDGAPAGVMDSWTVAGYGDRDHWNTVEGENADADPPTDADLDWIDEVTIRVVDGDGVNWYYTLHGPWESWEGFGEEVDDLYSDYGSEAA